MICPFVCNITEVTQLRMEYDDDRNETFRETKLIQKKNYLKCHKEECGMYWDGRCHYKQE